MRTILLVVLILGPGSVSAETLTNTAPEFEVEIPAGFARLPLVAADPSVIALYVDTSDSIIPTTIGFIRYGEEIESDAVDSDKLLVMPSFELGQGVRKVVDKYQLNWDGDKVNVAVFAQHVQDGLNSYVEHAHVAWVPLKGEAIQVEVAGNSMQDQHLKATLQLTLKQLDGPSSSSFGSLPPEMWFVFGPMLLVLVAGIGFMVYRGKRGRPSSTAYHPNPSAQAPPQPTPPQAPPQQQRPANPNKAPWEQ